MLRPTCHYKGTCPFKLAFREGRHGKETIRCISKGECNQQGWSFEVQRKTT